MLASISWRSVLGMVHGVVPLTDPPDGWEVLGDGLEDQEIRPDMMWQVSGNVAAGGIVYFRLPDASQPVGAAIPQWPQIVGPDQEVDADEFQRLAKANCYW